MDRQDIQDEFKTSWFVQFSPVCSGHWILSFEKLLITLIPPVLR